MKDAIIFDLDGTLWDATYIFKECYDLQCKKRNEKIILTYEDLKSMMGYSPKDVVARLAELCKMDINSSANYFMNFYKEFIVYLSTHPGSIFPEEEETLKYLSEKYDLYIVSNSSPGYVQIFLNSYNFNKYFKGFLQAGDTKLNKGDNIVKLMKDYNIKNAIYVGDTIKDYEECKRVNIPLIFASYGFGNVKDYKFKLNKISDLKIIRDKIFE